MHNLFQQSKWYRTIDLNTTHIVLFKSPRDVLQIGSIGRPLNSTQFLRESYELAARQHFDHLLNDLDPKTSDGLLYPSIIVPPVPLIFYLAPAKPVITNLTDERKRNMHASANATSIGYQVKKVLLNQVLKCLFILPVNAS